MALSTLSSEESGSPYAQQLAHGFAGLKFLPVLEKEFRRFYVGQVLSRGRRSSQIALLLVLTVAVFEWGLGPHWVGNAGAALGMLLLCSLVVMFVIFVCIPAFEQYYLEIAAVGVTAVGLLVTFMCLAAAVGGASYMLAAIMFVNLYACLFLGLRFYQAATISGLLVLAHAAMAVLVGLPGHELFYSLALLCSAAMIGNLAAYSVEHALRTNFLETRLLNELAERDGLTGLYNRRMFDEHIDRVWRQSRREGLLVEILLIDIDYFKIYNDLYGHQHGDDCLKKVALTISKYGKRPFDICARYGGEEFVLVLYGPPSEHGLAVPDRIRQDIMDLALPHEGSAVECVVTVSVGVSLALPDCGRSLAGAIQVADEALYEAKRSGRNCVIVKNASDSQAETGRFPAQLSASG